MKFLEFVDNSLTLQQKRLQQFVNNVGYRRVAMMNQHEALVPFNLWYEIAEVRIANRGNFNQNLRVRYIDNNILTPLMNHHATGLQHLESFLPDMTLLQPFFPETFFAVWEIVHHNLIMGKKFLMVVSESKFGTAEAIMYYYTRHLDLDAEYHVWPTDSEIVLANSEIVMSQPMPDYLGQIYPVQYLSESAQIGIDTYDCVVIDTLHEIYDVVEWPAEQQDFLAYVHKLSYVLPALTQGGSCILALRLSEKSCWNYLYHKWQIWFAESQTVRPISNHAMNPNYYLIGRDFQRNVFLQQRFNDCEFMMLQKMYQFGHYRHWQIECVRYPEPDFHKKMRRNYWREVKATMQQHNENISLEELRLNQSKTLRAWHIAYGLAQIRDLTTMFRYDPDAIISPVMTSQTLNMTISKPVVIDLVRDQEVLDAAIFQKLQKQAQQLTHMKSVMDTKPSSMFASDARYEYRDGYFFSWDALKRKLDFYQDLKRTVVRFSGAELVTNAWFKLWEILTANPDLIPTKSRRQVVKSFHLCEAPGAFVAATNHFCENREQQLDWYAQSLMPNSENDALDDHFGLTAKYPDRWLFGSAEDASGDVTHAKVIRSYMNHDKLQNLDFMTADAGLICRPDSICRQESLLAKINMGQIVCILACLSKAGNAVVKMFLPLGQPLNFSLIYLLTACFKDIIFCKPAASHDHNSEIYLLLKRYRGISTENLEMMLRLLEDPQVTSETMLVSTIQENFLSRYVDITVTAIDRQIAALAKYYFYYYNLDFIESRQQAISMYTRNWLQKHPILPLKRGLTAKQHINLPIANHHI